MSRLDKSIEQAKGLQYELPSLGPDPKQKSVLEQVFEFLKQVYKRILDYFNISQDDSQGSFFKDALGHLVSALPYLLMIAIAGFFILLAVTIYRSLKLKTPKHKLPIFQEKLPENAQALLNTLLKSGSYASAIRIRWKIFLDSKNLPLSGTPRDTLGSIKNQKEIEKLFYKSFRKESPDQRAYKRLNEMLEQIEASP